MLDEYILSLIGVSAYPSLEYGWLWVGAVAILNNPISFDVEEKASFDDQKMLASNKKRLLRQY